MNSKEKRKEKVKAALERVRDNPVLAHMRQVAYSPTSTQCIEEGDSLKTKLSSEEALKKAEEKRLKRQERNLKNASR